MTDFENLVYNMRQAQNDYLRTHSRPALEKARVLERKVDFQLEAISNNKINKEEKS